MEQSWLLRCGTDTVGTVVSGPAENWHNYGRLKPGPDYERYREAFEELWVADQELDAVDDAIPDAIREQFENRKERAQEAIERFTFYFESMDTHSAHPVHDFRPESEHGSVYWRWGTLPVLSLSGPAEQRKPFWLRWFRRL